MSNFKISCGNCHSTHGAVSTVRACYAKGRITASRPRVAATDAPVPARPIVCNDCHDESTCQAHRHGDHKIHCGRCAGTGAFITGIENGRPVGPGGRCFRCNGKGYHMNKDRRRNWGHTRNMRAYA